MILGLKSRFLLFYSAVSHNYKAKKEGFSYFIIKHARLKLASHSS
jgi:hypothetical protein